MKDVLWFAVTAFVAVISYKLGQKTAWEYIAKNYIAIHKSTILGPILIKREGNKNEKNHTRRTHKKASK